MDTHSGRMPKLRVPCFEERLGRFLEDGELGEHHTPRGIPERLSLVQQEMLFAHALEPDAATYVECAVHRITGPLSSEHLRAAVATVAARHDAFRAVFRDAGDEPVVRYRAEPALPFVVVDGGPGGDSADLVRRVAREPFDLERGPLARATLVRLAEREHLFIFAWHHIIGDGTARAVVLHEIAAAYDARLTGRPLDLPPVPNRAALARTKLRLLESGALDEQIAYWARELAGVEPAEIPGDRPRPPRLKNDGERRSRTIDAHALTALRDVARTHDASLFMTLITLFALLVYRRTGKRAVPIAFPVHGRTEETARAVGCFINTVVFVARFEHGEPFGALLDRSRDTLLAAYRNQDAPFPLVVAKLGPARRADQTPIASTIASAVDARRPRFELRGCTVSAEPAGAASAACDLAIEFAEAPAGLACVLTYRSALYDASTADGILAEFASLVDEIVRDPGAAYATSAIDLTAAQDVVRRATHASPGDDAGSPIATGTLAATVTAIWEQLLGVSPIGSDDDFFLLGGHSLLAMRMFGRIEAETGRRLPFGDFVAAPTIRTILACASVAARSSEPAPLIALGEDPGVVRLAPMSLQQQGLWLLERQRSANATFAVPLAWLVRGPFDFAALRESVLTIVRRHDALRTTFAIVDDEPVQVVHPDAAIAFSELDLPLAAPRERRARALELLARSVAEPFDLLAGPLVRVAVARIADDEHALAVTMHHIVTDGWSTGIFERELRAAYAALIRGGEPRLPALSLQYADFVRWQREWMRGDVLDEHMEYWRHALAGAPALVALPVDRQRTAVAPAHGGVEVLVLRNGLIDRLDALGAERGATRFMTLLAAFACLLYRYTGSTDLVIASPIANRARPQFEALIGLFASTLPLRIRMRGDVTFLEVLEAVRRAAGEAYDHQGIGFDSIVAELCPEPSARTNAYANVVFALQNAAARVNESHGIAMERIELPHENAKFDLAVHAWESAAEVVLRFEYDAGLFDAATIAAMAAAYETLLTAVASDLARPVARLGLTAAPQLPSHAPVAGGRVHERFEAQCARTPEATAIVHGRRRLTYRELNERANRLARWLRKRGVARDVPVGVYVERSPEMVIAALAILKAGGAYAPLDPAYPDERLAFMLADSGVSIVLTQRTLANRLAHRKLTVLALDDEPPAVRNESAGNVRTAGTAQDIAFLVYTSGSTGRPKGVLIPHAGIVRLVVDTNYIRFAPADVIAQVSTFSFDAATFELWGALLNGASLVIVPKDVLLSTWEFEAFLNRTRVSVMFLTTSLFNQHVRLAPAMFATLRVLMVGGEALDPRSIRAVLESSPPQHLLNGYGPTEATTFACTHEITFVAGDAASVPIGRPIANTDALILDADGNVVPPGATGELHLGGIGLAREYLGDPDLTARKFIAHPFRPGERLYRTGDLARLLPDGTIDYAGRIDGQVKIRGFRIEPGEIEAALRRLPGVSEAAVVVRGDDADARRLVAFITVQPGRVPAGPQMRRALAGTLPEYMLPSSITVVDALPLTPNGKRDLRALEAAEPDVAPRSAAEPTNPLHHQILAIWERLLDVRPIGIDDGFVELGGHSLLAARMLAEVEKAVGKTISPRVLLTAPTVALLAEAIANDRSASDARLTALQSEGSATPMFFWHGDLQGGGSYASALARTLGPDRPFYTLEPHGLRGDLVPATIEEMAEAHLAEIKRVRPQGPYLIGGFCSGGLVAFEVARRLAAAGDDVPHVTLIDAPRPDTLMSALVTTADIVTRRARLTESSRRRAARAGVRSYFALRRLARVHLGRVHARTLPYQELQRNTMRDWFAVTARYRPKRFAGALTLLVAREERRIYAGTDAFGWANVSRSLSVIEVSGDHLTCITRYAAETGSRIAAAIEGL